MKKKHLLTLWPLEEKIEVEEGKNLLQVFRDKGLPIKSSCGGMASCSDCILRVLSGEENLTPPTFEELKLLGNVFHITKERLSCQTKLQGAATVDISRHVDAQGQKVPDRNPSGAKKSKTFVRPEKKKTILRKNSGASSSVPSSSRQSGYTGYNKPQNQNPNQNPNPNQNQNENRSPSPRKMREDGNKRPRPFKYNSDSEED